MKCSKIRPLAYSSHHHFQDISEAISRTISSTLPKASMCSVLKHIELVKDSVKTLPNANVRNNYKVHRQFICTTKCCVSFLATERLYQCSKIGVKFCSSDKVPKISYFYTTVTFTICFICNFIICMRDTCSSG